MMKIYIGNGMRREEKSEMKIIAFCRHVLSYLYESKEKHLTGDNREGKKARKTQQIRNPY
jgi:hypothetical protein